MKRAEITSGKKGVSPYQQNVPTEPSTARKRGKTLDSRMETGMPSTPPIAKRGVWGGRPVTARNLATPYLAKGVR